MKSLFIHQNFPGQFVHTARYLVSEGHTVVSVGQENSGALDGVRRIAYRVETSPSGAHDYVKEFDSAAQNGLAVGKACEKLKAEGFIPDLVIGHSGWGETLFVKDVWPDAPLLSYFEFFYRAKGSDVDFDPEFAPYCEVEKRVRLRNAVNLLSLEASGRGQTPTRWQHELYPPEYRRKISVVHEGVETDFVKPDPSARIWLRGGVSLGSADQIVTFCARNLEPYRGFHIFMRALPDILNSLPQAQVLIVGGDGVSYGRRPDKFPNWRLQLMQELDGRLDTSRVHFLGRPPFRQYLSILQSSSVHIYLTYPFVLSWSLLEAMSTGCFVVASRTPPVQEAITDGINGWLVDFFDARGLAERTIEAMRSRKLLAPVRKAARESILRTYDLRSICLPTQISIWEQLIGQSSRRR